MVNKLPIFFKNSKQFEDVISYSNYSTANCVKANKILESGRSHIWLLLEQITRNLAFNFQSFSVVC